MTPVDNDAMLLPIGVPLGRLRVSDGASAPMVRFRGSSRALQEPAHQLWQLLHQPPAGGPSQQVSNHGWSQNALLSSAGSAGVADAPESLKLLMDVGMIMAVDPTGDDAAVVAAMLRLLPRVTGLRNPSSHRSLTILGRPGHELVAVPAPVLDVLTWSPRFPSLLQTCIQVAHRSREQGHESLDRAEPRGVLAMLLMSAPELLSVGAIAFDLITDSQSEAGA